MAQPNLRPDRLIAGLPLRSSVTRGGGIGLRLLCALALMLALALHRPPVAGPARQGIDLAQYTLPDGTAPDLCLTEAGEAGTPLTALHRPSCEACRLHAVAALPGPAEGLFVRAFYRRLVQAIVPDARRATPDPLPRLSSRGPPAPGHAALFAAGGRLPVL